MMNPLKNISEKLLPFGPFDALAVAIIDFEKRSFEAFEYEYILGSLIENKKPEITFDLASLSKPLINSLAYFLDPKAFTSEDLLCLNHQAGIPAWGLLSKGKWQEQIKKYEIKKSDVLYSDFSALRTYLNVSAKSDAYEEVKKFWHPEMKYWLDLSGEENFVQTGYIEREPNYGQVHDPNAYCIREFCSHAGVFSTIQGVAETLLKFDDELDLLKTMQKEIASDSPRFVLGWDRVLNPQDTLAGNGCGPKTFGHLGFTGTSIWIDPDLKKGHVILTNAVKEHWYDKKNLNDLRRALGETVWKI